MSTTGNYTPDHSALLVRPWTVVQLSQRDVSSQIPLNHVAHPGIDVTSACFGNNIYEEQAMVKCISNLLALDNRRFHVDLYWSTDYRRWTFCPVTVNSPVPASTAKTRVRSRPVSVLADDVGSQLCSQSLDVSIFLSLLRNYFSDTNDTLNAHMLYILLNVHFAASSNSSDEPSSAPARDKLPSGRELLGSLFHEALGPYMYTPKLLQDERANLNQSWYSVPKFAHPIAEYFTTHKDSKDVHSTPDGWPCEAYVERRRLRRFLVGWASADAQMAEYDFNGDSNLIFSMGSLARSRGVTISNGSDASGDSIIKSGCLFDRKSTDPPDLSASWPESTVTEQFDSYPVHSLCSELMACGISPIVNSTLSNVTADENFKPYKIASQSSSWAWAQGQPHPDDSPTDLFLSTLRCARADASFKGRWFPAKCSGGLYGACRVGNEPFQWTLTREQVSYGSVAAHCPENSTFSVPRTGLENTYLYQYLISLPKNMIDPSSEDYDSRSVWIDLNSRDVPTCWVSGGPNAQCPYEVDEAAVQRRTVLVPTVAAIIVLVIAALTIFVKCNSNRRNSRWKRIIEGWEYEGVPS
ncbi:lectin C-type domain-containing protein [Histoplasma capsulatum G186AR]|uniref:Maintenance of telomere capping protein 6 n=2 Tax=Ajellomyces capsulatus TaxID=5037 RepID=C0NCY3_AJECG|nr:lectin C-type domain-containing protein [Histoplasma capsulatum G186AR]EEH11524.1 lectin C-type domain-containing protein [Histoplasma capsulatum G186AR]KAG5302633.1 lectin C-type domain-containing protein [Histoplasma capsulatum]QSS71966.1 lectin C-type domain-containing protein [Histoplasma capsulatum G186AR]